MEAGAMGAHGSTCCFGALNQWMGNTHRISSAYRVLCAYRRQRDSSGTKLDCLVVVLFANRAVGLTNFLVDAGIPDQAIDWVQSYIQSPQAFLLAAVCFIALAGALMEIYAALVVLVPLMLPLAMSYGIHPVHFGIVFLATLEMGFLCPPAGMNLYFASAVFRKPLRIVMTSILPALLAIFVGSALIALMPEIALTLPKAFNQL
jgi:TRAP-type C4-dicarboxylate transport system permease large subunit